MTKLEIEIAPDLIAALDRFAATLPSRPERAEALLIALNDWAISQGYLPWSDDEPN